MESLSGAKDPKVLWNLLDEPRQNHQTPYILTRLRCNPPTGWGRAGAHDADASFEGSSGASRFQGCSLRKRASRIDIKKELQAIMEEIEITTEYI
ncbi:hypothetical protein, partial [Butyricicoccus sp.]|uniref:hypothetical protein n=1 Tax=Butyricicoccus sp. TaxID=2049021 RepID=UPI003F17CC44